MRTHLNAGIGSPLDREAFDDDVVATVDDESGRRIERVGGQDRDRSRQVVGEGTGRVGKKDDRRVCGAAAQRLDVALVIDPGADDDTVAWVAEESRRLANARARGLRA